MDEVEQDDVSIDANQNGLMAFNFEESNIRTATDEKGEVLFLAKDVCDVLGYANSSDAIFRHCKNNGIVKRDSVNLSGKKYQITFINEPNLMRLVVKSKLPAAEKFEAWVFEEVLPTIRKTGAYTVPPVVEPPKQTTKILPVAEEFKAALDLAMLFGLSGSQALIANVLTLVINAGGTSLRTQRERAEKQAAKRELIPRRLLSHKQV